MKLNKYQIINVQAYKHDGELYRQWNGALVFDDTKDCLVLILPQTKVIKNNGQHWRTKEPTLWYFPKHNQFYNATALIRKNGYYIYTNLASPFVFENNTLKFIDYDLDIKYYPGSSIQVVDVEEYKRHIIKYNYSKEVCNKIEDTKNKLLRMIHNKEFIYAKSFTKKYMKQLIEDRQYAKIK